MINLITLVGTSLPRLAARYYPDLVWHLPSRAKVAYLTFDDGPNPTLTAALAATLERYDAKGSFFLLGSKSKREPRLVRDLVDAGHVVGNHSFSHPDAWRSPGKRIVEELERTTRCLEDITGRAVAWMRPPYGHFTRSMRDWCLLRRQRLTMWDIGPGDYLSRVTQEDVERHVAHYVRPGSIIVLHDNPCCADVTPRALESILHRMTAEGWSFPGLPAFK